MLSFQFYLEVKQLYGRWSSTRKHGKQKENYVGTSLNDKQKTVDFIETTILLKLTQNCV